MSGKKDEGKEVKVAFLLLPFARAPLAEKMPT